MNSRRLVHLAVAFGLCAIALALGSTRCVASEDPITTWARRNAQPFATTSPRKDHSDLKSLRAIVGPAHIVGLGEGTHGTREFFQMKHRILEYLATEMGFHYFAIEAGMPAAHKLNDYVLHGLGDPRALLAEMHYWMWNTQEVLDMVGWMRALNASGRGHIEFLGFDMQNRDSSQAIVNRWVAGSDPAYADSVALAWNIVARARPPRLGFDTATGMFPSVVAAGHRIEFSGYIRTRDVVGSAGLWWRADFKDQTGVAFSNMSDQVVDGTRGWKRYELTLDIPQNTTNINFGMMLQGRGTAWFDSLSVSIDGKPWSSGDAFDLAIENPQGPIGFTTGMGRDYGYEIQMDDTVAMAGRRSLRIESDSSTDSLGPRVEYSEARAVADRVVQHLSESRRRLGRASSARELEWVIQNARIVEQRMAMGWPWSTEASYARDSCMALNVEWILANAPKGAKIALWAHDSHVSRRPGYMGEHLARRHGADYVVLGSTTARGHYRATMPRDPSGDNVISPPVADSLEERLVATGIPRFLLDLRNARGDPFVEPWLQAERPMRMIGSVAMSDQFRQTRVGRVFDAIVWVDSTSATVALPTR